MDALKKIELVGTSDGKPTQTVKIIDCGEVFETKAQHTVEKEKGTCDRKYILMNIYYKLVASISC